MLRGTILVAVVLVLVNIVRAQQASEDPGIMIAVYNDAGVPEGDLAKAEKQAAQVLSRAGLNVSWSNRFGLATTGTGCAPAPEDVVCLSIHIIREPRAASGDVFGMAFVDPGAIGKYIDVFYGRVRDFDSEKVGTAVVLGHVIAHETGHLLLGLQSHSKVGIMQPHWYGSELRKASMGNLLFTPEQAAVMLERIRAANNTVEVQPAGQ